MREVYVYKSVQKLNKNEIELEKEKYEKWKLLKKINKLNRMNWLIASASRILHFDWKMMNFER